MQQTNNVSLQSHSNRSQDYAFLVPPAAVTSNPVLPPAPKALASTTRSTRIFLFGLFHSFLWELSVDYHYHYSNQKVRTVRRGSGGEGTGRRLKEACAASYYVRWETDRGIDDL